MEKQIDITFEILDVTDESQSTVKTLKLPILPPRIDITSPSTNEVVSTIKLGEVSILKNRGLRSLTIESFFPATAKAYPFCRTNDEFVPPREYIDAFESAKENKRPCRLTIENIGLNSFYVSIEDFTWTFGQTGDVDYSLSLREYRPYGTKAKNLERTETMFSDGEDATANTHEEAGQEREPTDYAVGDKVIVNGMTFSTEDGWTQILEPAMHVMTNPYSAARAALMLAWDLANSNILVNEKCIIIDKSMDRVMTLPTPVGDHYEPVSAPYNYCIADLDSREKLGWVAKSQLRRL